MNGRRLRAMIRKEAWQAMRDPSTLLVTFLLPPLLLFLFAYGVSLDVKDVRIGLVLESDGPHARELAAAYQATPWLEVKPARHRKQLERDLVTGKLAAYVVIPQDFDAAMESPLRAAQVQIITDGSLPSSANFTASYARGVFGNWLAQQGDGAAGPRIQLQQRFWFNPELESRQVLAPGAIAIVMTMIGTMLTAIVIAREWERGAMEALLATPASITEVLLSKLLPYFVLGMLAILACAFCVVVIFSVPLRGSLAMLLLTGAIFLIPVLGQGLLISTLFRSQFDAGEVALLTSFLPAVMLSGFVFEIQSMPQPVQWLTHFIPARYFIEALQTVFLVGDSWRGLWPDLLALLLLGSLLFALTFAKSRTRLD